MAALAMLILIVATLATGATRHEVYRNSAGRAGGRIGRDFQSIPLSIYLLLTQLKSN